MKRLIFLLVSVMMLSVTTFIVPAGQASAAGLPSLEGLTYDELVALRDQINLAIWNSQEWQEVTVPAGVWKIGESIPAGHWSIRMADEYASSMVYYFETPDETGMMPDYIHAYFSQFISGKTVAEYNPLFASQLDLNMLPGWYFYCDSATVFSPYAGKPDLGFK